MKNIILILTILPIAFFMNACNSNTNNAAKTVANEMSPRETPKGLEGLSKAYFASGCFWCVEAIFESVEGVEEAISGYSGGTAKDATYNKVSAGITNHAEVVEVFYNSEKVSYATLLKVFFGSHDPTTLNKQGPDRGAQYRSAIFYQNEEEKDLSINYIQELNDSGQFARSIVTEVAPLKAFYEAEQYHQNYERLNPNQPYIRSVSIPRLQRFQSKFPELLKKGNAH